MARGAPLIAAALLGALAALMLVEPLMAARHLVPGSYVEGWIADHAARLQSGGPLYDGSNMLRLYNYPPLYALLLAHAGGPDSDLILLGRSIASLSTAASAAAVFALSLALGSGALAAWIGACFFVSVVAGAYPGYVASNDPTMLGQALMTAALALFAAGPRTWLRLLAVAGLVCLAGFFKHNLVSVPLAITVFLALREREQLLVWLACAGGCLALALLATTWAYGSDFFDALLGPRRLGLARLLRTTPRRLLPLAPGLLIWALYWVRNRDDDRATLIGVYVTVSLATAALFTLGDGVHHNVMIDATVALAVALAACVTRTREALQSAPSPLRHAAWLLPLLACAMLVPVAAKRAAALPTLRDELIAHEQETRHDLAYLKLARRARARDGAPDAPLLCERPALCYWAGVPARADLFSARQAFLAGVADESAFIASIERRDFAAIQLDLLATKPSSERISPALLAAILRSYRVRRESANGFFLHPGPS